MTTKNEVLLEGLALGEPEWSHENHGTQFYRVYLQVPRLSGQVDVLPVLLPGALAAQAAEGRLLRVRGQLRSFNNRSGVGSRLVLTVYAQELQTGLDEPCNQIILSGALCKPPVFRRTPLGRSICDLMLAVPRRYGRADYLPVIAWGQLAVKASRLRVGDALALEGRVQSRTYHKVTESGETEERVAYEVSMMRLPDPNELEQAALSP
ncbi:single-stranded DNA-binding protein [uncultured Oscillibacter sp.]|uniref:single-stranded DNA-binding protein n=1 Tax=uncultured Oscillibacter sp. TaxID=876091 RepID=UPI0025F1D9CD|nr:single-stranded DNA-binding protein [uncultured Oscillibacter sp.]